MGAFDQFNDKAKDYAEQAKGSMGNKRNKSADGQGQERAERGVQQEGRERRSGVEDQARERMDRESHDESQDDWA
ncbi:hypothetical protein [Actinacidiphila guanduensis]|jgi:hypothetical protein|uniref:Uncharacterized protein n=1 Tax=Actinacidiphila guanduensis TaxID=310781 RepID=A0A1H0F1U1_9ACTN|nr:hypothetical protein [Actinacidiphila guanduensis]SDN88600.1 hypothetical protein SAMN05216259_106121 [Actinacidiphila guanduensis]